MAIERSARPGVFDLTAIDVEQSFVASVVLSELWVGYFRAETESQRSRASALLDFIQRLFEILPFDAEAARIRAQLFVELRRSGVTIGERDLQIAATALAAGHSVLTGNVTEFSRIPGPRVIPWPKV